MNQVTMWTSGILSLFGLLAVMAGSTEFAILFCGIPPLVFAISAIMVGRENADNRQRDILADALRQRDSK